VVLQVTRLHAFALRLFALCCIASVVCCLFAFLGGCMFAPYIKFVLGNIIDTMGAARGQALKLEMCSSHIVILLFLPQLCCSQLGTSLHHQQDKASEADTGTKEATAATSRTSCPKCGPCSN
jgi:hypothetical protein